MLVGAFLIAGSYSYYPDVSLAIQSDVPMFIGEGEPVADALCFLDLVATTNIGGSGKWANTDSTDLAEVKQVVICPDMDKPGVKHFLRIYQDFPNAKVLLAYPDSPVWDDLPESGGVDVVDWIEEYHLSKDDILKHVMDITPELLQRLERQFENAVSGDEFIQTQPAKSNKKKITPANVMGIALADEFRSTLRWNNESKLWMRYEADYRGVWSVESDECIESIIADAVVNKGMKEYGSHSYIVNVVKTMRGKLIARTWEEKSPKEYIPFQNGVLEIATGKVVSHSPGFRFTWCIPRDYKQAATNWETISSWMDEATGGKEELKQILLCFCNAVLKGRADLQKFLHLTGHGGTGKGTFMRLLVSLIGECNVHSSTLNDWCGNQFESANGYRKRLVVFWDEDKFSGKVGKFKSLTGGDFIRGEQKGRTAFQYIFDGMVVMSSNYPVFVNETSSGLNRRVINVPFTVTPKDRDSRLQQKLEAQLDAFTNHILAIPDEVVTSVLLGEIKCKEVELQAWEHRKRTDSVAWWLDEYVIRDAAAKTPIGSNKNEAKDFGVGNVVTLFGSYYQRCSDAGKTPKAITEFSGHLLDLCKNILGWSEIQKGKTRSCNVIFGLRLRQIGSDDEILTLEEIYSLQTVAQSSTSSKIEVQQALEPSTALSTSPSTPSSTVQEVVELQLDLFSSAPSASPTTLHTILDSGRSR
ncbi:hypothetical protein BZZ01_32425 [Nostocales cyanobacterium HT-58-2]|nr:hypothetical protein BZZ01_32425 [Nostocales cyanobacterium HT-58-2]